MGSRVFLILLFTSINAALIDDDNFFIAEKMDLGWFKAVVTYNSVSLRMNCIAVLAIEMNHNDSFNFSELYHQLLRGLDIVHILFDLFRDW